MNRVPVMDDGREFRVWCAACETDEHITIESAHRHRRDGVMIWDVDYSCTNCGRPYGHEIRAATLTSHLASVIIELAHHTNPAGPEKTA